jgi:hypothetical protein
MRRPAVLIVTTFLFISLQATASTRPKTDIAAASPFGISSVHDVGIIPGANGCPAGSELITFFMDDEDGHDLDSSGDNNDHHSGWIGAIEQDKNTTLKFCRVDGALFTTVTAGPFAVLQLSNECPAGGTSYGRLFENERHNNQNQALSSFGYGIGPNESYNNFTLLKVCIFNNPIQPQFPDIFGPEWFPDLGFEYGVFGSPTTLRGAPDYGTLYTDDEDGNVFLGNRNSYDPADVFSEWMPSFISPGVNSELHLAKVRPYCFGKSVLKINGQSGSRVNTNWPDWPIIVNGSGSTCADVYFISIQLSDANGSRYGTEAMRWLTSGDYDLYGHINNFNIRRFAQDQSFVFVPGQYYRVKLGVGPAWNETTTLVHIAPFDRRRAVLPPNGVF